MRKYLEKPWLVLLLSSSALLVLAVFSVGYYHPDEHFQIMEFAGLKLQMNRPADLAWEYHARMRPAIQPAIVVLTHHLFALVGCTNPFTITLFLRMLSAALALASMWMIWRRYSGEVREPVLKQWFLWLSFLLWFILYNNVRFSSENWSGSLFIIGFSWLFMPGRQPLRRDYLLTGVILGLSFIMRYQAGILIAGFVSWFIFVRKERVVNNAYMVAGLFLAILAGILVDRWFYGEWTLTAWNYFQQNILADKVSSFGINPWYFYFSDIFIRAVPPFSLVFIGAFLVFFIFRRNDLLTWTLLPFILIHCLIGHKETRFFYPLIGFIPVITIAALGILHERGYSGMFRNRIMLVFARIFWIVNAILVFICFLNPADSQVNIYKDIYTKYPGPVTLYFLNEDPYHRALDIHYYRRAGLTTLKADSAGQLNALKGGRFLVAAKSGNREAEKVMNKRKVGSSNPEWIMLFNFNHWVERTAFWNVYEVDNR